MRWRRHPERVRFLGAGVLAVAMMIGGLVGTHIIYPDPCVTICASVAAGETSWWLALAMGCWCKEPGEGGESVCLVAHQPTLIARK